MDEKILAVALQTAERPFMLWEECSEQTRLNYQKKARRVMLQMQAMQGSALVWARSSEEEA